MLERYMPIGRMKVRGLRADPFLRAILFTVSIPLAMSSCDSRRSLLEITHDNRTRSRHSSGSIRMQNAMQGYSGVTPRKKGGSLGAGSAVASILRLSHKRSKEVSTDTEKRHTRSATSTYLRKLRDYWITTRRNTACAERRSNGGAISTKSSGAGIIPMLQQMSRAVGFGFVRGVRRKASTMTAVILGIAYLLSIATSGASASRLAGWGRFGSDRGAKIHARAAVGNAAAMTMTSVDADQTTRSEDPSPSRKMFGARERAGTERQSRLFKAPRFPLATISWWQTLQDHRKRKAVTIAEKIATEDHEVTQRAEGAQVFRSVQFWGRSATIYLSYKKMQARCAFDLPRIADEGEREKEREARWSGIHELNSDRMLNLCLDLRGFYLKSGQFLGTRHDFMPKVFLKKLGKLHDDVPPMAASRVRKVLSRELDVPTDELFSSLNVTHPVGSASISQVHRGVLRATGERVAVKPQQDWKKYKLKIIVLGQVQYPGAERVMMSDLRNLKALAWFLQKFELNFDILSSLRELSKQIKGEFDFRAEARTMDRMHISLGEHSDRLNLPQSRLATKRLLVMSYLEGESLAQLKRSGKERFVATRKRIGKSLLHELAGAWGFMIFQEGLFNADPHPGNILIMPEDGVGPVKRAFGILGLRTPKLRIGLLDWGQIKEVSRDDREKVAKLILAVCSKQSVDVVSCFKSLGVKLSNPDDADSIEKLALVMFDTRTIKGLDFNPFSNNNVLKLNAVQEYPQDLYFILRTVLMFRGMAQSLGVEFSLADFWAPHAARFLASSPS